MVQIAIFASGSGTNAQNIIEYFKGRNDISVSLVLSNKEDAYVLKRSQMLNVPSFVFSPKELKETDIVEAKLSEYKIDFIVLAGFLLMVPAKLIKKFPDKIINVHPALLPKYGGKGMYGEHVHETVIANGEKESGISIHYVNERYDEGNIIFQARCEVKMNDTPETLATRIHELEHKYFPQVIEKVVQEKVQNSEF
ncbi:MAG TPA: phosphoribosylglycinamide formyltransferase [Bacteroidales bacterium]|nr:phosphoribosylglycinamide formyltransferase [Bacteroidales bacterium]HPS15788.1 phosphoribosylglycinamide formyltransferase [Bacteroidales bacterium]